MCRTELADSLIELIQAATSACDTLLMGVDPHRGDLRTNPAAVEHRAVATNLARVLGGIAIADTVTTPRKDPRKQRGAQRKWARANGAA